jgi:hypothetical protein
LNERYDHRQWEGVRTEVELETKLLPATVDMGTKLCVMTLSFVLFVLIFISVRDRVNPRA